MGNNLHRVLVWAESETVDLHRPLTLSRSFRFPLQNAPARQEVLWGSALLLLLPGLGWLLNMGHRIEMVHRMDQRLVLAGGRIQLRHSLYSTASTSPNATEIIPVLAGQVNRGG